MAYLKFFDTGDNSSQPQNLPSSSANDIPDPTGNFHDFNQDTVLTFLSRHFRQSDAQRATLTAERQHLELVVSDLIGEYRALKDQQSVMYKRIQLLEYCLRKYREEHPSVENAFASNVTPIHKIPEPLEEGPDIDSNAIISEAREKANKSRQILRDYLKEYGLSQEQSPSQDIPDIDTIVSELRDLVSDMKPELVPLPPLPKSVDFSQFVSTQSKKSQSETNTSLSKVETKQNSKKANLDFDFDNFDTSDVAGTDLPKSKPKTDDLTDEDQELAKLQAEMSASGIKINSAQYKLLMRRTGKRKRRRR